MARVNITIPGELLEHGEPAGPEACRGQGCADLAGVTLVLDSGGISALTGQRARLAEPRDRGLWPPQVPAVVLAEALTGDSRRDHHANRLLRTCQIRDVDELQSREAARLRTATGRASTISAVDAVVAAVATSSTR